MHTIEVYFEVFKQLTVRRETESVTYNDVIRELLGLEKNSADELAKNKITSQNINAGDWITKGIRFPNGTEFRSNYKGQIWTGRVESAALIVNGKRFSSPSAAAMSITQSSVNGWRFWECKLPGKTTWQLMEAVRR